MKTRKLFTKACTLLAFASLFFGAVACVSEDDDTGTTCRHKSLEHFSEVKARGYTEGSLEYWHCTTCNRFYADENCKKTLKESEITITAPFNIPDFVVEVEANRDIVVLQLTDTQIIDKAQARPGRDVSDFWATDKKEERCYAYIRETIEATKPDFIIITGDIVYGEFDDDGSSLLSFVEFMESFEIPWSPVFGNHDNESKKGVDWQCEQFENAEHCLFEQRELTGNGNYSVGLAQGGELKRVFYMLDSNGCANASEESKANGHTKTTVGFGDDQIAWYTSDVKRLKKCSPNTKISFAYHIQQAVFYKAFLKYGFNKDNTNQDINIDTLENKAEGDFGYIGRGLKTPWDNDESKWKKMKELGVDSIFVGHEHCNSASVVFRGVRLQYGQKSSEYDRFNCIAEDGTITGAYEKTGTSLIGGTVVLLSKEDGIISDAYIYYCGFQDGKIDWTIYEKNEAA